jgi:hypothetical protein
MFGKAYFPGTYFPMRYFPGSPPPVAPWASPERTVVVGHDEGPDRIMRVGAENRFPKVWAENRFPRVERKP